MTADDDREHEPNEYCWCEPELYFVADNGNKVWVHHDPDGILPSPAVIARAIAIAWNGDEAPPETIEAGPRLSWIEKMILRLTWARKRRER